LFRHEPDPASAYSLYGSGQNAQGQIGQGYFNGSFSNPPTHTSGYAAMLYGQTENAAGMKQVATGANHNLARRADGSLFVWGNNKSGVVTVHSLGLGGDTNPSVAGIQYPVDYQTNHTRPRLNPFLDNVALVAAGGNSSFAVRRDGAAYAWGQNAEGQLGVGGTAITPKPTSISGGFHLWTDTDADGLPDEWETHYWSSLASGANDDPDSDGVINSVEWERHLNPASLDTDGDLFSDGFELQHTIFDPSSEDLAGGDYDGDGLNNFGEYMNGSNPGTADTDNDGVSDQAEVANGSNPTDPADAGTAPPAEEMQDLHFGLGGDNASWEMTVTGKGPQDYRVQKLATNAPGGAEGRNLKLRRGNSYEVRLRWLKSKEEGDATWYCWQATVDHQPAEKTFADYNTTRLPDAAEAFIVGGHWLVDNADGLLTYHTHMKQGEGGNVADSAVAMLFPFEVNVDADNTTVEGYPDTAKGDLSSAEKAAQDSDDEERYPGVRVYANFIDPDTDGVVGYADGIDKFTNGQANSCWKFEPMLIRMPSLENFPNTAFIFKYSSSDPDQMTQEGSGPTAGYVLPQGKILRLWKKDGDEVRQPESAHENGDFIRADQEYTPQQLGWQQGDTTIRLYIEVVDTSTFDQSTPVDVEFYPTGKDHPESVAKERIKVRPYYISRENPDTNSEGL
jgi:hypothetical protein